MAEWNRNTPWRQGHLLSQDAITTLGLRHAARSEQTVVIVASHDCDLAQAPEGEPKIEIVIGCLVTDKDGNCTHAKNARKLHRAACGKCPVLEGFRRISTDRARRKKRVRLVKAAEPLIPGGYRASLFARNRRRSRPRITPRQRCHPGRAGADQRDLACPRRRTSIVSPRAITIVSIPLRNSPCSTTSGIAAKRAKTASPCS